jgi:serine protease Do
MRLLVLALLFAVGCPKPVDVADVPRDRTEETYSAVVALLDEDGDSFCTGVMVEDRVLTAGHCVDEVGEVVQIGFYRDYVRAHEEWSFSFPYKVVADEDTDTDLALLAAVTPPAETGHYTNIPVSPDSPYLGQPVFAIGHPAGLPYSLGVGIVSVPYRAVIGNERIEWTQVTVGVTPGNSGGPLLNIHGELLGICSFRMQSRGGGEPHLGGFIHISSIKRFLAQHRG